MPFVSDALLDRLRGVVGDTQADLLHDGMTTSRDGGMSGVVGNRYEILGVIGHGGMGTVFRARDRVDGTTVALKIPHAGEERYDVRFARESVIAAESPTPYLDHGVSSSGTPYLAMPLLKGSTLHERLHHGPLPLGEALSVVEQVAEVLGELHARGYVHRDVTPRNVFLSKRGEVLLLDLGLVGVANASVTSPGMALGTEGYMAPEQCRGESVGPTADVYALGRVLLAAIGRPALDQRAQGPLLRQALGSGEHIEPIEPIELASLLASMLALRGDERPCDGQVVAERIRRLGVIGAVAGERLRWRERTPFVGRVAEMATLASLLERFPAVMLVGPEGAGKARLVAEWWRRHGAGRSLVWVDAGAVRPLDGGPQVAASTLAWGVACACLDALTGLRGTERNEQRRAAHYALAADLREDYVDAKARRTDQGRAFGNILRASAAQRPLSVVIERVDRADRESLELIRATSAQLIVLGDDSSIADELDFRVLHVEPLEGAAADGSLDELDPYARWMLRLGSHFGMLFPASGLVRIVGASEHDTVFDALARLCDAELLVDWTKATGAPSGSYRFATARLHELVLAGVSPSDRELGARLAREHLLGKAASRGRV